MLDSTTMTIGFDAAYGETTPVRPLIAARLGPHVAQAAILLSEALGLALIGAGIHAVMVRLSPDTNTMMPPSIALALAYAALVLATDAHARPPRRARTSRALRVLGVMAIVLALASPHHPLATIALLAWLAGAGASTATIRRIAFPICRRIPCSLPARRPIAFIGNSEAAAAMLDRIASDPGAMLAPIGYFDDRAGRDGPLNGRIPHLGRIDDITRFIHERELHEVFMALPWAAGPRIASLIERLRFLPLTVRLLPDHVPPAIRQRDVHQVDGVVMPTLMLPPFSAAGAAAKRLIDVVASIALLVPLAPLMLAVALAIRLDSAGPVLFLQPRSGRFGRPFHIFKFRSLHVAGADAAADRLVSRGDARVTRVGRFIRKYSIDELPQILNVLLGDMSLVGPRPHAPRAKADGRIYAEIMPDYMLRYRVRPGMTGWAQVNGWRGNTDTVEKLRRRVEFDFDYITSWSLGRDFRILARTVPSVLAPTADNH